MNVRVISKHVVCTLLALIALGVPVLYATRSHPVIFEVWDDSIALRPRNYCLLNPFRDQSPETTVEGCLEKLRAGHIRTLFSCLNHDGEFREHILEVERQNPVLSWRIGKRIDEPDKVRLMYWVRRAGNEAEEAVFFSLVKTPVGWMVRDYSAIYR